MKFGGHTPDGIDYIVKISATGPTYTPPSVWGNGVPTEVKLKGEMILRAVHPCFVEQIVQNFTPLQMPSTIIYELRSTLIPIESIQLVNFNKNICKETITYEVLFNG